MNSKSDETKIKAVIQLFVESGDERNLKKSEQSLHPDFSQYLNFMGKGVSRSTKSDYESMLKAGKIGGEKRQYEIKSMVVDGEIATAKVVISSPTFTFHDVFSLMKENDEWKIVSLTMRIEKK